jgi:DNA-binding NarL/FixJ family response regulator
MTPDEDGLLQLIAAVYDAALDPALWPSALGQACGYVGGGASLIFWTDYALKTGTRFLSWGDDPEWTRLYFEKYIPYNPMIPAQYFSEVEEVKTAHDLTPYQELVQTKFYKEWMAPQGYVDNIYCNLDKSATSYAAFAIGRTTREGPADEEARRRMRLLVPHVRRAVLIGKVIDLHRLEAASLSAVLDSLSAAMLLVDAGARIVHVNAAGRIMLDQGDVVRDVNGIVLAREAAATQTLHEVFAASGQGDPAVGTKGIAVQLRALDGESWLAHVMPLTSGARQQASLALAATAVVFVRRASLDTPSAIESVAKLHKLTASELRVLQAVVDIGGVPAVAEALGISEATVKTHLQHLFAKTGTRRQIDLVKLVAGAATPFAE